MGMMNSFYQIVILCFALLVTAFGCSSAPKRPEVAAAWFKQRKSIRLENSEGKIQPHLFYDPAPELERTAGRVNFLPTALSGDDRAYELDHLSGQRYFSHFWCGQVDAWKKRGSTSRRPTFTRGVVPRVFDQLHEPQQIIVFGSTKGYDLKKPVVYPVRIVGGLVEQVCKSGRCSGPNEWLARLVLVAVNENDRSYRDIENMRQLQDEIDWRDVQNQLENHEGHNLVLNQIYPAIRVGNLLEHREVLDYMKDRSVILTAQELVNLNRQCGILYLKLWKEVGTFTTSDSNLSVDDVRKRIALREDLRKRGKPSTFHQLLSSFFKEDGDALATCSRLVYPGNPSGNYQRFWFASWVTQYVRLHKEGWRFSCSDSVWLTENEGKEAMEFLKNGTGTCSDRAFDTAMETMPTYLQTNRSKSGDRWTFLEWDNNPYGTHSKLYSWVKVPERQMTCNDDTTDKVRARWLERPEGDTWPKRNQRKRKNGLESEYIF